MCCQNNNTTCANEDLTVFEIFKNDTTPFLTSTLKRNGIPVDLTNADTAQLILSEVPPFDVEPTFIPNQIVGPAEITTPISGKVRYVWSASDTVRPGKYKILWKVTFPDLIILTGRIETFAGEEPKFVVIK